MTIAINETKVTEAIESLTKFLKKQSQNTNQLLDIESPDLIVLFSLTVIPKDRSYNPSFIQLPHPVYPKNTEVCLFTGKNKTLAEKLCHDQKLTDIKEIIDFEEFSKTFKTPEQKRELSDKYSLFVADDKILPQLSTRLGNAFFKSKKLPMKLRLNSNLKDNLSKCLSKSSLYISSGSLINMRIGTSELSTEQLSENAIAAIQQASTHLPGGFQVVKSISIKSYNTPALPIYESSHLAPVLSTNQTQADSPKSSQTSTAGKKAEKVDSATKSDAISNNSTEKTGEAKNSSTPTKSKNKKAAAATKSAPKEATPVETSDVIEQPKTKKRKDVAADKPSPAKTETPTKKTKTSPKASKPVEKSPVSTGRVLRSRKSTK